MTAREISKNILKFAGMMAVVYFAVGSSGCTSAGYYYQDGTYEYNIDGLGDYTGNGKTVIYIPAVILPDKEIFDAVTVDTDHGTMHAISQNNTTLSDVHGSPTWMHFLAGSDQKSKIRNMINVSMDTYGRALKPVSGEPDGKYTRWRKSPAETVNYTSYVYIDENITPVPGRGGNITVKLHLNCGIGQELSSKPVIDYNLYVDEVIPESVRGWIPVTVQVEHTIRTDL